MVNDNMSVIPPFEPDQMTIDDMLTSGKQDNVRSWDNEISEFIDNMMLVLAFQEFDPSI